MKRLSGISLLGSGGSSTFRSLYGNDAIDIALVAFEKILRIFCQKMHV